MSQEWIEWNGGACPVPGDTMVDVELRSGAMSLTTLPAARWNWTHGPMSRSDIIAYRIVEPVGNSDTLTPTDAPKTLRDEFAMAALTGLSSCGELPITEAVKFAYLYADAMLEARKQ